jgi:hypothetical protein
VAGRAITLAGHTLGAASSNGSGNGRATDWQQAPSRTAETGWHEEPIEEPVSPVDIEHPHDETEPPRQPRPAPPEPLPVQEPVHVSEEPQLVQEFSEPGAEDGAGAQMTVMEPWNGYARMNARDVIERARASSPAELAAVRLYEARHRSRQTVLAAVDRQLKLTGGGNPA